MTWDPMPLLVQGNARKLPLANESVNLIVTSPPYFGLRSYSDGGEHYTGQIGSEPTWQEYLDNLLECTREMMRVLKPSGSIWLNLGDKFAGSGGGGQGSSDGLPGRHARPNRRGSEIPEKSLHLLPHRYAIRCIDELGLIVRQDQIWAKVNGLPESVTDRTRREHEYLFHMVKSLRYYSAVDEIREPTQCRPGQMTWEQRKARGDDTRQGEQRGTFGGGGMAENELGKLPGSVWSIASQPLNVPDHISHARCCDGRKRSGCENELNHYAAFPFALVRPIILGWSPREVCTACGEGRRPIIHKSIRPLQNTYNGRPLSKVPGASRIDCRTGVPSATEVTITDYACSCPGTVAPVTTGVVLDPFGGTASAALVAAMNGRTGISVDASWDYTDLIARWRIHDPKERARAAGFDSKAVARIHPVAPDQISLLDLIDEMADLDEAVGP